MQRPDSTAKTHDYVLQLHVDEIIKLQNNLFTNPLEQFEIRDYVTIDMPILFNIHLSFNNMIEYLLKSFLIIILLNIMTTKINKILYKY